MAKLPFALQLYSVRDALQADLQGTLHRVKAIGYDHVETADLGDYSPERVRAALDEAGLRAISAHVGMDQCRKSVDDAVAACKELGADWAVIPWLDPEEQAAGADWVARAKEMEQFGAAFREAGLPLCYHNHTAEFGREGDSTFFELMFDATDPELLHVELDTGWAHYAGAEPMALLRKYSGRTPLIHIKDVKSKVDGEEPVVTELGNGATPFSSVFKVAGEAGVKWLIVEQDSSARDPLESARMNAAYMRVHVY